MLSGMHVAQVQIQLSSDLVAGLNRQLKDNRQLHNQVTLLTLNGSILPDATVFLPTAFADAATAKVSASQPCSAHSCALQHESSVQMSSQPPSQQSTTQQDLNNEDMHAQSKHNEALDLQGPCQPHANWQAGNLQTKCAQAAHQLLPALCVEIKPKWGLLPMSPAIAAKHAIKKQVSRFQLQQHLKLAQVSSDPSLTYQFCNCACQSACACISLNQWQKSAESGAMVCDSIVHSKGSSASPWCIGCH
jgi:hypothetical protein